ncbi:hypothetical protein D9613_012177 [Agrocybe pediades]|uniref:DNA 3'-5' helicase n=1 Tax=Agrocybe pediades TaxID=84607 RepID=A0A8H4R2M3_9AGAR|nr:hypothetical protein D9613_012177 [Agrocybe pediades]
MPPPGKIRHFREDSVELAAISTKAVEILGKHPFDWQLQAAKAIYCGQDVVLDAGTGFGKTLCFSLPLLLDENDLALTISPLSALMIEQAAASRLPTVAVCQQTTSRVGSEHLYHDTVNRKFRQVIVSPEIAVSNEFLRLVLSKKSFTDSVRVVNIDEAHCISEWGGTFRKDYSQLGTLRGRFPKAVCFQVASATLPEHVLDRIKSTLRLSKDIKAIRLTNERPNIALSVRTLRHSKDSKADLRFLIPAHATSAQDIPITLVYCNKRDEAEDCVDRLREWAAEQGISPDAIAYYHALIGEDQKRQLEDRLDKGDVRIQLASEALGMGCDLRKIRRVVLWGLPLTFCSLVQRAGRAGRDLTLEAEAILLVPSSVMKQRAEHSTELTTRVNPISNETSLEDAGASASGTSGFNALVDNEGVRIAADASDGDNDDEIHRPSSTTTSNAKGRRQLFDRNSNSKDLRALLDYAQTKRCRREPWNQYFNNKNKLQLLPSETTTYNPANQTRCCDNCEPRLFQQENILSSTVDKGFKKGKKKKNDKHKADYICTCLRGWRKEVLAPAHYGENSALSTATLMWDKIIEALATCGEQLLDYDQLRRRTRWAMGHDNISGRPNSWGVMLMGELAKIYKALDEKEAIQQKEKEIEQQKKEKHDDEMAYRRNTLIFDNKTPEDYA